jgi:hypothetical protein
MLPPEMKTIAACDDIVLSRFVELLLDSADVNG